MRFFIPIPLPLALFVWFFIGMARLIIWAARAVWRYVLVPFINQYAYVIGWAWGYTKTKIKRACKRKQQEQHHEK